MSAAWTIAVLIVLLVTVVTIGSIWITRGPTGPPDESRLDLLDKPQPPTTKGTP